MSATLPAALVDELDREPAWMYAWQLGSRSAPVLHPMLESIHATRAALVEHEVREVLAAAGPKARALDLACCEGWFAHRLLDWGAHEVLGVEVREQSVRRAELVRDHVGIAPERLRFETADVLALSAEELGGFDVVLCLGLIYHVEHPMGVLRLARAVTRGLCVVESQTARVETPALFGFGARQAFDATDAVIAVHHEADYATNPLASFGGALSFCPNPAALSLMTSAAGFADVRRARPGPGHDPDYHSGDRAVLFARPG
ncbi:MAG: tRNA (mo5U34)-methyltransferase [Solirubrobacteraceae bacterium]|nr:tRNA (mo5U34)-methyltransferase [Solirubrobacteraceae bacterium]